jgi:type I restriction enzyme, S subunit
MRFVHGSKIHITPEKASQLSEYDAQGGDVVISRSGTVGEVCVVPDGLGEARISTNLMRVRLLNEFMLPQFFCMLFNGSPIVLKQISSLCSGSTRDFLNTEILMALAIPVPPLPEQQRVVVEVEHRLSVLEEAESQIAADLKRSARLRQSILKRAFEGKLVPHDPKDEPAAKLLERIKTKKADTNGKGKPRKTK